MKHTILHVLTIFNILHFPLLDILHIRVFGLPWHSVLTFLRLFDILHLYLILEISLPYSGNHISHILRHSSIFTCLTFFDILPFTYVLKYFSLHNYDIFRFSAHPLLDILRYSALPIIRHSSNFCNSNYWLSSTLCTSHSWFASTFCILPCSMFFDILHLTFLTFYDILHFKILAFFDILHFISLIFFDIAINCNKMLKKNLCILWKYTLILQILLDVITNLFINYCSLNQMSLLSTILFWVILKSNMVPFQNLLQRKLLRT